MRGLMRGTIAALGASAQQRCKGSGVGAGARRRSSPVARMMPSGREWRQPYTLSNLDLVTQSLTLMAGILRRGDEEAGRGRKRERECKRECLCEGLFSY